MTALSAHFDGFQREAVDNIVSDFSERRAGRYLLVIPTGGGKTFTAVKAVNALYQRNILDEKKDRVAWIAHRQELLDQARDTFDRFEVQYPTEPSSKSCVDFLMMRGVAGAFGDACAYSLAVIDEAHHGAAISYQPIFALNHVGVLGLTATPTRHDGKPLEFERESFSIGFPDLISLGIILRPDVIRISGGRSDIRDLDSRSDLELLNNDERNRRIVEAIAADPDKYTKVVVYVGTVDHVTRLYEILRDSPLAAKYDSVAWITGDGNSRRQDRKEFLDREKVLNRSILINVQVLAEGYDDPTINTVVMATPTHSKLVYMQAMGRAIRRDPNNEAKRCYVIEIDDDLPNIRYRIDNRWLYSDVSDALEPAVIDLHFESAEAFTSVLEELYDRFEVPPIHKVMELYKEHDRYSMLLFKVYSRPGSYFHVPLLISNSNRRQISNVFNFLSERMRNFVQKGTNSAAAMSMLGGDIDRVLPSGATRRFVYDAMANAASEDPVIRGAQPWITFVSLTLRQAERAVSAELLGFIANLVNRAEIMDRLSAKDYPEGSVLVRLPLPLQGFVGKILNVVEAESLGSMVDVLRQMSESVGTTDHRSAVSHMLNNTVLPIEPAYIWSLPTIVREGLALSMRLP